MAAAALPSQFATAQSALLQASQADQATETLLRAGGVVIAFRHALAPGTFDPPQFRLGDCSTQRNLNDEGRAQAVRMGEWFRSRKLAPARVRSSPWCRCVDTATLAFSSAAATEKWPALGSPRAGTEATNAAALAALRQAARTVKPGQFEVWITHMFVLQDLAGVGTATGEGLVLGRAGSTGGGGLEVLARLQIA